MKAVSGWSKAALEFAEEGKLGYRLITHICAHCGGGMTIEKEVLTGCLCVACGRLNR